MLIKGSLPYTLYKGCGRNNLPSEIRFEIEAERKRKTPIFNTHHTSKSEMKREEDQGQYSSQAINNNNFQSYQEQLLLQQQMHHHQQQNNEMNNIFGGGRGVPSLQFAYHEVPSDHLRMLSDTLGPMVQPGSVPFGLHAEL
ncbi:hypothetical protein Lal_00026996, partial [Lupinus albus]